MAMLGSAGGADGGGGGLMGMLQVGRSRRRGGLLCSRWAGRGADRCSTVPLVDFVILAYRLCKACAACSCFCLQGMMSSPALMEMAQSPAVQQMAEQARQRARRVACSCERAVCAPTVSG